MFKKGLLILIVVISFCSISIAEEITAPQYMDIPTTERHITQIKWAHNQGYVYGILANYGIFKLSPYPINFVLPIINTAWEMGYVEAIIDIQRWEEKDEDEN